MYSSTIQNGHNELNNRPSSNVLPANYIILPMSTGIGQYQLFSYNQEFSFEFKDRTVCYIKFTRMDDKPLKWLSNTH